MKHILFTVFYTGTKMLQNYEFYSGLTARKFCVCRSFKYRTEIPTNQKHERIDLHTCRMMERVWDESSDKHISF